MRIPLGTSFDVFRCENLLPGQHDLFGDDELPKMCLREVDARRHALSSRVTQIPVVPGDPGGKLLRADDDADESARDVVNGQRHVGSAFDAQLES